MVERYQRFMDLIYVIYMHQIGEGMMPPYQTITK